ncbi:geranylgeranyltransferase I alpha subunit Cwp1 [Schizosaccharomyces cryophilus OY26]|uniref:Protein farnesyltransferase/geranylgeranyltransferase type-1 subunit alpha n=1 Tax=Schizosaccharomyces cryophilus (strain OY26 / ATCC MYA-4695 / CBS 11777 / NBRC 106824 / NRRL Y48691) TaxID=653667 RepID=S9W4X7_SCHCR|nr:geranylgeranyltransferase I alpha subunit Cwp1 [Schizosaccharomyces cryophilus OY26]EPY52975.1 geranylgeranyltransferase I alpha subunit Cwp1 [Schizosaccharomyces cryophilus OY26]
MEPLEEELVKILDFEKYGALTPIPQDDGVNPLAKINYSKDYEQGMAYFRALAAKQEYSIRAFNLTCFLIMHNPAHYTVWAYRFQTLKHIPELIPHELAWLDSVIEDFQKNYQVWHHRQKLLGITKDYLHELEFTKRMFDLDSKNYHVWSYRLWILQNFHDYTKELSLIDNLLEEDVYNNSAWNHRFFVLFESNANHERSLQQELEFLYVKLSQASDNQSAWNYLSGILKKAGPNQVAWIANQLEKLLPSSNRFLLEFLAEYDPTRSKAIYENLANEVDRDNQALWNWMIQQVPQT